MWVLSTNTIATPQYKERQSCLLGGCRDVRNRLISNAFSVMNSKKFEIFGFDCDFDQEFTTSILLVSISNRNLLFRNFLLRFRHKIWYSQHFRTYLNNGKQEIWGLWRHCYFIRIFKNIILVAVLILNNAAKAYWFWFWFRICSK